MFLNPIKNKARSCHRGLTLIELTVVIVTILSLISVMFINARAYVTASHRTSCIVQQDQLYKTIIGHARMNDEAFEDDIEYYTQSIADGLFPAGMQCPSSDGAYTILATESLDNITIICNDFGTDHRH